MPVYKDKKNNTWYVKGRYKDWTGKTKDLTKRGFTLKRDAVEWEENFHLRLDSSLYMSFAEFYQIYKEIEDDPRCKTNDAKRQIARFVELHETNIA